jgi:hypothetical protein
VPCHSQPGSHRLQHTSNGITTCCSKARVFLSCSNSSLLLNLKVHRSPPLDPDLSHMNLVHSFMSCFSKIHFDMIFLLHLVPLYVRVFLVKILHFSYACYMFPSPDPSLNHSYYVNSTNYEAHYVIFCGPYFIPSHLGPNILLSTFWADRQVTLWYLQ